MRDTKQTSTSTGHTVDPGEVEKFTAMAASWWDPDGDFRPLHKINPTRLRFITEEIAAHFDRDLDAPNPLAGLRILDVGCGGGLVCEPLARLGAQVTGVDATPANIPVAEIHAEQMGLEIDYRVATVAELVEAGERFD
ncbi:MAG: bifunctional 2-polyprenyl-6-hydroxyphenol methylase/3-demethylubiquinol 3-O-methyltransferase UbiG, partial [Pseudomonadota bacterium]|nr:bifunctional 2-polyprenyl-6-hydroxyphenol methylase/3-demethylubiquinol 3-O-methyltransferase UbiG [Pseudomonadota bacterium]